MGNRGIHTLAGWDLAGLLANCVTASPADSLDQASLRQSAADPLPNIANRVRIEISRRPEIQLLMVNYNQLVDDPENGVAPIAKFLGPPFDSSAAARAVVPNLHRQINRSPAHPWRS